MINYEIRRANINDLEEIQRLNKALCVLEQENFDPTTRTDYSFSEQGKTYFTNNIESSDSFAVVAEVEGKVVGYLIGSIKEPEDFRTITSIAEADNTFVEESYRGKGIGSAMYKEFENWCKERGVQKIRHTASAKNINAIAFYESSGSEKYNIVLEKDLL
jgi:ribosomal protein S18 acetylase RimI-like enzyme